MKLTAPLVLSLCSLAAAATTQVHQLHAVATNEEATSTRRDLQTTATWEPGNFSKGTKVEEAAAGMVLLLSNGLKAKAIGVVGGAVKDKDGIELAPYHGGADGGACFPKSDGSGGYYYVSNSEIGSEYDHGTFSLSADRNLLAANLTGGVYSFEFTADHQLVGYKQVLSLTTGNCAGGTTPWGTWISCEERRGWGQCWQVDPSGTITAKPTMVARPVGVADFGAWEAFAWDGDSVPPRGYVTNDDAPTAGVPTRGTLVRFTPDDAALTCLTASDNAGKWCALESGSHDFLKLTPSSDESMGTFEWVSEYTQANPELYKGSEGIHYEGRVLTFAAVTNKHIFRLDLDKMTYKRTNVPFPQEPDNLRILNKVLYLCTDGDKADDDGVWGIDNTGAFRVFKETGHNYPAGVAFSPDAKVMYVSMWGEATYQITREDGLAFSDATGTIVYEQPLVVTAPTTPTGTQQGGSTASSPVAAPAAASTARAVAVLVVPKVILTAVFWAAMTIY